MTGRKWNSSRLNGMFCVFGSLLFLSVALLGSRGQPPQAKGQSLPQTKGQFLPQAQGQFRALENQQDAAVRTFARLIGPLRPVLARHGVSRVNLEGVIFTHTSKGTIANTSVMAPEGVTPRDLLENPLGLIVGVHVSTVLLEDPQTGRTVPAGAYAVRLRPEFGEDGGRIGHVVDYLNAQGRTVATIRADLIDPEGLEDAVEFGWTDRFQPFALFDAKLTLVFSTEGLVPEKACLSFLFWEICWTPKN